VHITRVPLPTLHPPQSDQKYMTGLKIRNPEGRLRYFVGICSSKRMDDATGAPQPQYRCAVAIISTYTPALCCSYAVSGA
jgi:hypothetical protein